MPVAVHETIRNTSYKDVLTSELKRLNPAFGEIFGYGQDGELFFKRNGLKPVDLLKKYGEPFDAPIQITDLVQVTQRAGLLKELFWRGAEKAEYPKNKLQFHYASKANLKGPVIAAALKEVDLETSGEFDLYNFEWMRRRGIIPQDRKIICNGLKNGRSQKFDKGYGPRIIEAFENGADITPVLVQNELPFFQKNVEKGVMNVGLRLKFGQVSNDRDLASLKSRFGFDWGDLQKEAEKIKGSPNLNFTMLHAMISAAHTVEPNALAESALFAVEKYAVLKRQHPTLTHLNFGGGFPTIDSGYNHEAFLETYLSGVREICRKYGVDLPTIVVESGSFIATDTEHLVYKIVDSNVNSSDGLPWITINGGLINLPDIWVQEDPFTFVAANNANAPLIGVRIGDLTCDSNCVYPPKDQPDKFVKMPEKLDDLVIIAVNTGAYQDVISGIENAREAKGVNHCAIPEPVQVYVYEDRDGNTRIWSNTRASIQEQSGVAGFADSMLHLLK